MPITGSAPNKTYTRTVDGHTGSDCWQQNDAAKVGVFSADFDEHDEDMAVAIRAMWMRDGGNQPTANLPMNSFKLTGLGDATAAGQCTTYGQVVGVLNAPSGTSLLCFDAAAPTGWTIDTSFTDCAVRIHTTGGGTGGTVGFTTAFASKTPTGTVGGHTLTTSELPSHTHSVTDPGHRHIYQKPVEGYGTNGGTPFQKTAVGDYTDYVGTGISIQNTGGGGSHNHGLTMDAINLAVKYMNGIKIIKD
jgi:hypothetical protein